MWKWLKLKLETMIFSRLWTRWVTALIVFILIVAGTKTLVATFQDRRYVAEVNPYEKIITKYRLEEGMALSNLSSAPVLSEDAFGFDNADEYFDLVAKEYETDDFDYLGNAARRSAVTAERQETQGLPNPVESSLAFDEDQLQLVGELKNYHTLRRFAGFTEAEAAVNFPEDDSIALSLDQEANSDDLDLDVYFDKRYLRKDPRLTQVFAHIPRNKFYTSPPPLNEQGELHVPASLKRLKLILDKAVYYSHELVRANLVTSERVTLSDLKVFLRRGKYLIANVGGKHDVFFKYRDRTIFTTLTPGYSPSPGVYHVVVRSQNYPEWEGIEKSFVMKRRPVRPLPKGFGVVNLEYTTPLGKKTVIRPNGRLGDYNALIEWVKYTDSDAFWMLAAQTVGWDRNITPQQPWKKAGLNNLKLIGPATEEQGILLGAYIMCYYTPGNGKRAAGYRASLGYTATTDSLLDTRHISLTDPKRYKDLLAMAVALNADTNVDFIGFDFIRTGRADGYEMAVKFIDEMNVSVPTGFYEYSAVEQTKWLARRIENLSNKALIFKWRWWRAHLVAGIINSIIVEGKLTKPTWVFTLGWRHGQEHGQDPNMFFDAGVTADAVMLYEANRVQFANLMRQWSYYMRNNQNNVIIGNATDVRFLDSYHGIAAIEYVYRTKKGYRDIYRNGLAKGIFMHDLSRALWSSKRGYHVSEWALIHGHSLSAYRHELGLIPYEASMRFNADRHTGVITVTNTTAEPINSLQLRFSPTPAWEQLEDNAPTQFSLAPQEVKEFVFQVTPLDAANLRKDAIIGYYLHSPSYPKYFFFTIPAATPKLRQVLSSIK